MHFEWQCVAGIAQRLPNGIIQTAPYCGKRYGGMRESQLSALRAPATCSCPRKLGHCEHMISAVNEELERAQRHLQAERPSRSLMLLEDSLQRQQDKDWVREVEEKHFSGQRLYTLIPDFYTLDPNHVRFENVKYPPGHTFHSSTKVSVQHKRGVPSPKKETTTHKATPREIRLLVSDSQTVHMHATRAAPHKRSRHNALQH
jgi:hypothetical protein